MPKSNGLVKELWATELTIDTREPEYLRDRIAEAGGSVLTIPDESGGDFLWYSPISGSWAVERKDISDLISSLFAGRLVSQLRNCRATYDNVVLLIEGHYVPAANGDIQIRVKGGGMINREAKWSIIEDAIDTLQMMGVMRVHSHTINDTVTRIRRLMDLTMKEEHGLMNRRTNTLEFGTKMPDKLFVITSFPGIGIKMGQELINQFHYLNIILGMFQNNHPFLKDVPGLGKVKIEQVRKVLTE